MTIVKVTRQERDENIEKLVKDVIRLATGEPEDKIYVDFIGESDELMEGFGFLEPRAVFEIDLPPGTDTQSIDRRLRLFPLTKDVRFI